MRYIFSFIALLLVSVVNANAIEIGVGKGTIINLPRPAAHVFIANPEVADIDVRSSNYIYVYGLKVGETSLHALDANNRQILQVDVVVTQNYSNLNRILKEVLPNSDIHFSTADTGLIMQGEVDTPEDAQKAVSIVTASIGPTTKLVNMLKVKGSDQVMLRVRVAEVSRTELKNFGINLGELLTNGSFTFGLFTGRAFETAAVEAVAGVSPAQPATLIRNGNNIRIGGDIGSANINAVIDALETKGLVKVLAEPNLTAKSGETASFLAGGEFPIPIPQENGVITIEYREFGVKLDFTPTVLGNDKISLRVAPEVSSLTTSTVTLASITVPSISTRRVLTTVELGSGETFAIAGLMRNDVTNDINKFPWLGDLPILGLLFRSNNFQNNESELVVLITPYIVRPVKESAKVMTPTDGYQPPNDFERILLNREFVKKYPAGRAGSPEQEGTIAKYRLNGDAGYILE